MSNYPYRLPPSDTDRRAPPGPYGSSEHRHTSPQQEFYRPPQETSSSRVPWSQDGALNLLSSCGLEPSDLALLAELPEDVLTVESLPHVLKQIKGKRGTVKPPLPTAPPPSSSSVFPHSSAPAHRPTANLSANNWSHHSSQPVLYPLDKTSSTPLSLDSNRWGSPMTSSSVGLDPPLSSSSSSRYMVDYQHQLGPSEFSRTSRVSGAASSVDYQHRPGPSDLSRTSRDHGTASSVDYQHRPGPSEFGKMGRDAAVAAGSSVGPGKRSRPSRFSQVDPADYRLAPPPEVHQPETRAVHPHAANSSSQPEAIAPSKKEAQDFHGTCPLAFPYSCSLCDITVMSEKVWSKHVNGTGHADGQLGLLQRFPAWDCRLDSVGLRADSQSETKKDAGTPVQPPQAAKHNTNQQQSQKPQKKTSDSSKVVCVKFPPQSVDEAYLRKLTEPFGKIVKILMFPSLAFVELGSVDQAKDLVKFHINFPPTVNGQQMEFSISKTFSFLQSSRVVSLTPCPSGQNGRSDLISIVKRFGSPLYTLFLPSKAYVEMKDGHEAQKLVDYYASTTLRINGDIIKVSYSGEYKSLMRVTSAQKYDQESDQTETKRTGSRSSPDKSRSRERSTRDRKTRSSSRSRSTRDKKTRSRSRSRDRKTRSSSRSRSTRDKKTRSRSRSRDRKTRSSSRSRSRDRKSRSRSGSRSRGRKTRSKSRSRQRSTKHRKTKSRSRSKEKSKEEPRSPSGSKEKSASEKRPRSRSGSKEKSWGPETSGSRTDAAPDTSKHEDKEEQQSEGEALSSADDSDIEGMEVIGEDLENLDEEDLETMAEVIDTDEEEEDKEMDEETRGDGKEKKMEEEEEEEDEEEEQEEVQFPLDLENCITLDELDEQTQAESPQDPSDSSGDDRDEDEPSSWSTRVVSFRRLPIGSFTDTEFIRLVRDFGTPLTYFIRPPGCGFIEMSSASEARNAADGLSRKPVFKGSRILVELSYRYRRLSSGWKIPKDQDLSESRTRSSSRRRSERLSKDESNRISQGKKESRSRKTPDKESRSSKSPDKESRKTPDKESRSSNSPEKESRSGKTPEKESRSSNSPEKESRSGKTPEKEFRSSKSPDKESRKTPEKESRSSNSPEKESRSGKTPEKESRSSKSPDKEYRKTTEKESRSSKSPDKESRKTPEKESRSRKTPEKESRSRKTPEKESRSSKSPDKESRKTPEKESRSSKSPDKESRKTPDKESRSRKTPDKESRSSKSPEKESRSGKTPEKEPRSGKTPEKESRSSKSPDKESRSGKTPEKESRSSNSPEKESRSGKTPEKESRSSKSPDKESRKTPEKESRSNKSPEKESGPDKSPEKEQENRNRKTPNKGSRSRKTPKKEPRTETSPEKESWSTKSPERESGSEKSQEIDSVSSKTSSAKESTEQDSVTRAPSLSRMSPDQQTGEPTLKTSRTRTAEPDLESVPTEERVDSEDNRTLKRKQTENSSALEKRRKGCGEERDHEAAAEEASGPEPSREDPEPQDPEPAGGLQDHQVDPQPGPAGATADPSRPVGTEFVRPVVGYFCNLCQLIYADEDEAKQQHCSSLSHYIKYQEKTGRDPWTS